MKKSIVSMLLMALAVACVMRAMMSTAKADTAIFTAQLLAGNEVAPTVVNPSEAGATGSVQVTLTFTKDSGGNVTSASSRFDWNVAGLSSNSTIILSHIHEGAATVNGPVRVDSLLTPGTGIPTPAGAASFSRSGLATSNSIATAIIANPSGFYFNIHTALSPGGVARGQLVAQQAPPPGGTTVPTLSQWGAILMFLLILAAGMFFVAGRSRSAVMAADAGFLAGTSRPIDWKLLTTVTMYVEAAVVLGLVALHSVIATPDIFGSLAAGLVVAFIVHLLIRQARK